MNAATAKPFPAAWKAAGLIALTMFPLSFAHLLLHEGGHALAAWAYGAKDVVLFVHPFAFSGYSRPIFDVGNGLYHAAGLLLSLAVPLALFPLTGRIRSAAAILRMGSSSFGRRSFRMRPCVVR